MERTKKGRPGFPKRPLNCCAPEGTRTPNLLIRSQMLYPLSYGRLVVLFNSVLLVKLGGGERI